MDNGDLNINAGSCIAGILSVTHLQPQLVNRTSHVSRVQAEVGTEFHKHTTNIQAQDCSAVCVKRQRPLSISGEAIGLKMGTPVAMTIKARREMLWFSYRFRAHAAHTIHQTVASVCQCQDRGLLTVFDRLSNRRVLG